MKMFLLLTSQDVNVLLRLRVVLGWLAPLAVIVVDRCESSSCFLAFPFFTTLPPAIFESVVLLIISYVFFFWVGDSIAKSVGRWYIRRRMKYVQIIFDGFCWGVFGAYIHLMQYIRCTFDAHFYTYLIHLIRFQHWMHRIWWLFDLMMRF